MKTHSTRGVIPIWLAVTLAAAVVGSGVVSVKKGFGIFSSEDPAKVKEESKALVESNAKLQAAEAEAARLRKESDDAKAAVAAQRQLRYDAAAVDVAGVVMALKQEPEPSLNVVAALSLAESASKALDPVAEAQLVAMAATVRQLTSANAQIRAAAQAERAAKDAEIAAIKQREEAKQKEVVALESEKATAEIARKGLAERLTSELSEHAKDTANMKTLGQKLASFTRWTLATAALLAGLLWVLPIIAKAHPELAWLTWIAKKSGAVVAYGLHALHEGEKRVMDEAHTETRAALDAAERKLRGVGAG